jgi:V/A-type H+-transporting ATPase subunit A
MTSHVQLPEPTAEIVAVQDDLVTLAPLGDAPLIKNEVVYIIPHGPEREGRPREYLKAEVLRVRGTSAEAQVFESTAGVRVGDQGHPERRDALRGAGPGTASARSLTVCRTPSRILPRSTAFSCRAVCLTNALNKTRKWAFEPAFQVGRHGQCRRHAGPCPRRTFRTQGHGAVWSQGNLDC